MIGRILKSSVFRTVLFLLLMSILSMIGSATIIVGLWERRQPPAAYSLLHDEIARLLYGGDAPTVTQEWHGLDGYEGKDYKMGCGTSLYSPVPGIGVVMYNGLDGYRHEGTYPENTMMVIEGIAGKATIFHGTFTASVGEIVIGGESRIGRENSIGWSTGCHTHLTWEPNPAHKPIKISWYDPARCITHGESINCDEDPSRFSTNIKVRPHHYGNVAACPPAWTDAKRVVVLPGIGEYRCIDKGGGIIEEPGYIWIDLLAYEAPPQTGAFIYGWYFEEQLTNR